MQQRKQKLQQINNAFVAKMQRQIEKCKWSKEKCKDVQPLEG